jgi:hypothetical protein
MSGPVSFDSVISDAVPLIIRRIWIERGRRTVRCDAQIIRLPANDNRQPRAAS